MPVKAAFIDVIDQTIDCGGIGHAVALGPIQQFDGIGSCGRGEGRNRANPGRGILEMQKGIDLVMPDALVGGLASKDPRGLPADPYASVLYAALFSSIEVNSSDLLQHRADG